MTPGQLIRSVRKRRGLGQEQLARRMGTRQSAISRLENDEVSPTVETLQLALRAMGERLKLESEPAPVGATDDPLHYRDWLARSPEERLRLALSWNRMASRLEAAGRRAKASR